MLLFKNEYQGGADFTILDKSLENWKMVKIAKEYEREVKGYCLCTKGTGSACLPKDPLKQSAHLVQPYLVLQIWVPLTAPLALELNLSDVSGSKRKFLMSAAYRTLQVTPLHVSIPLSESLPRDTWVNLVIDLSSLISETLRGQTFRSLDAIHVTGSFKLRRIFTLKDKPFDVDHYGESSEPIPRANQFPPGVEYTSHFICLARAEPLQRNEQPVESPIPQLHMDDSSKPHIAFGRKVAVGASQAPSTKTSPTRLPTSPKRHETGSEEQSRSVSRASIAKPVAVVAEPAPVKRPHKPIRSPPKVRIVKPDPSTMKSKPSGGVVAKTVVSLAVPVAIAQPIEQMVIPNAPSYNPSVYSDDLDREEPPDQLHTEFDGESGEMSFPVHTPAQTSKLTTRIPSSSLSSTAKPKPTRSNIPSPRTRPLSSSASKPTECVAEPVMQQPDRQELHQMSPFVAMDSGVSLSENKEPGMKSIFDVLDSIIQDEEAVLSESDQAIESPHIAKAAELQRINRPELVHTVKEQALNLSKGKEASAAMEPTSPHLQSHEDGDDASSESSEIEVVFDPVKNVYVDSTGTVYELAV
ncbi:hypothetical protein SmJEL517_g00772 [Synchytrium microbalum]|uniref:CFA20 domain-containing protein n=1 Tax=Synchytrium microbalum TaxID=1806994 RepID=A0A507CDR7_9FUNG|nr:uncharacterized protein SmJEL517_g00772 [Synchytrium microbalum]TPX37651.1 hypothetical protein SmJEL517_g00772 [Synchytrium microbalum]